MRTKQNIIATLGIKTTDGIFAAHYSRAGLVQLDFPCPGKIIETEETSPSIRRWHKLASRAVARVLARRAAGPMPPLDLSGATAFQAKVWAALSRIQTSETKTYGQVAAALGAPQAARAVGSACGANPVPLLIPCHRVLAAGRRLGGFSGGLDRKRKLLAIENIAFSNMK
jgi:O-6-methylguanine DNA methyltransferase